MRGDARPFGESGTYFCDCGVTGSVSASFLRRVKTVSNPTPAVTATSSADTNWILSAGWTVGAVVQFHTAHKLTLMAHSPVAYRDLGQLVAGAKQRPRAVS